MKSIKYKNKIYNPIIFKDYEHFTPNISPEDMVSLGIFGGTYFRSIFSSVLNKTIDDAHLEHKYLFNETNQIYDKNKNFYKEKCGTELEYWESKNWIKEQDPYGWFQWYVRFYHGRRTDDDARQIGRWIRLAGPEGRFNPDRTTRLNRNWRLTNKIRQVLLHWGYFTGDF